MSIPRIEIAPGYSVSRLLKGGWQLAGGHGSVDRTTALADMARFVDAGITTFDCADIYTGVEELIGECLRGRRAGPFDSAQGRPAIQVHTKYVPDIDTLATLTRRDVEVAVDRSLTRLGVERLDLVQLHWWNYQVPRYVEVATWLDECRRAGKIAHLGVTNFDTEHLREVIDAGVSLVSHQVQYSVMDRRPAAAMTTLCQQAGIQLLCYGAIAGGFLSDRYLDQPAPAEPFDNRSLVKYRLIIDEFGGWDRFQALLRVLRAIADRHGVAISAVALRWVLNQLGVAGVIVGARHSGHLADLRHVASLTLTPTDCTEIARAQEQAGPSGEVYELERVRGGSHGAIMRYTLNAVPIRPPD